MSFYYSLPRYEDLNLVQQTAVNYPDKITLHGGPGTGKSVVTLWRHLRRTDINNDTFLLTYSIPLSKFLISSAQRQKGIDSNASKRIFTTLSFLNFENKKIEIIFDEAQDIPLEDYENFKHMGVSYAIDPHQSTNLPKDVLQKLIEGLKFNYTSNKEFLLDKNYRNTKQIIEFVHSLFPHKIFPKDIQNQGPVPTIICTNNKIESQKFAIKELVENFYSGDTHNIAILVPTSTSVDFWYDYLMSFKMWPISKYTSRVKINTIENVHITTYKSSKGFEFDTVIIPDFQNSRFDLEKPKKFTNENEIYVALTRCKKNLYLIDNSSLKNDRSSLVFFENAVNKNKAKLNYEYK